MTFTQRLQPRLLAPWGAPSEAAFRHPLWLRHGRRLRLVTEPPGVRSRTIDERRQHGRLAAPSHKGSYW